MGAFFISLLYHSQSFADFYARLWVPAAGDVYHSGAITLVDVILALQIITKTTTPVSPLKDDDYAETVISSRF